MPNVPQPLQQRLKARSGQPNPITQCVEYLPATPGQGTANPSRAMYMKVGGKTVSVLKIVWELYTGHTTNRVIRHTCHNKRCINPNHLKAGDDLCLPLTHQPLEQEH